MPVKGAAAAAADWDCIDEEEDDSPMSARVGEKCERVSEFVSEEDADWTRAAKKSFHQSLRMRVRTCEMRMRMHVAAFTSTECSCCSAPYEVKSGVTTTAQLPAAAASASASRLDSCYSDRLARVDSNAHLCICAV